MPTQSGNGELSVSEGGDTTVSIPSAAANTIVIARKGRLVSVLVTVAGAGAGNVQFFDNATTNSGTVIGILPATLSVTGVPFVFNCPVALGIVCQNVASGPVMTVSFF